MLATEEGCWLIISRTNEEKLVSARNVVTLITERGSCPGVFKDSYSGGCWLGVYCASQGGVLAGCIYITGHREGIINGCLMCSP